MSNSTTRTTTFVRPLKALFNIPCRLKSDFLRLDVAHDIMPELFWSPEELKLRGRHPLPNAYFLVYKPNRTDKIGYLKKPITLGLDRLRELDPNARNGNKRAM